MIRIRPFENQDLDQIVDIEFESFSDPYPKELFRYLANISSDPFLVAVDIHKGEEVICGYAIAEIQQYIQYRVGHLLSIAISKQYRRKGIGTQLLSKLIGVLKSKGCNGVVLEVRTSNRLAITLYQKMGFYEVQRRRRYYDDGEDALVMALDLEEVS